MDTIHKQHSFAQGIVFTILSAIGFAFVALIGKFLEESIGISSLIFWRYLAAFFICLLWMLVTGQMRKRVQWKEQKLHILRALFVLGAQYSFFFYLHHSSLFNALILLNTGPIFIPLIERFILRKHVGKSSWIGVLISFVGVVFVLKPNAEIFSLMSWIGILAGCCQGISQVIFGLYSKKDQSDAGLAILFLLCAVASVFPFVFTRTTDSFNQGNLSGFLALMLIAMAILTLFNQLMRRIAYKVSPPSRVAPFLYFNILCAAAFDWWFFQKIPDIWSTIGGSLVILGGVAKIYLRNHILNKKKIIK